MFKRTLIGLLLFTTYNLDAQKLDKLTVEKIMRDPKWIGTSPSNPAWSLDGKYLYFSWNPDKADSDSLYFISMTNKTPVKASVAQKQALATVNSGTYNLSRTSYVYSKEGDLYFLDLQTNKTRRITHTTDLESSPQFSFNETKVVYTSNSNLFAWDLATGETWQLTNLQKGSSAKGKDSLSQEERWLKNDQLEYFEVLKSRKEKKDKADAYTKNHRREKELRTIYIDDKSLQGLSISPDGRFITYRLTKPATNAKPTIIPSYVTESGFTTDISGRTKVGSPEMPSEFYIYDRNRDTVLSITTDQIPGIRDLPDYLKDYPKELEKRSRDTTGRPVIFYGVSWSPKGSHAILDIRSFDNKDRWLMLLDTMGAKLKLLDRQRDEAWIGGPGTGGGFENNNSGWLDENVFWFQSEATGFSHLYSVNILTGEKKALTTGKYEVKQVQLSRDKKTFYLLTNEVRPGEQQYYRLPVGGGRPERITTMTGANLVTLSPDEKNLAIIYSYSNKPWELYLQENKVNGRLEQITNKAQSEEFKSYSWKDPDLISFKARDGALVYARLYKPASPDPHKPAVLFVHGAGYLQNAHKWWSSYFREYMFNNLLADNGYYVLDIDYRGSAGYGRDWRTGIYRHMGGKDLEDNVDGADYLVKNFGVDPKRIGLYGGSYGGFIALMALFTTPDVFAAGAALRPVTDWANYNHDYTSNILNEPFTDSLAYRRSSPYYFAEGLKNHLLICHGMIDVNVHFQDAVKLTQRLIELGKDNWEIAPYPLEDHGFVEPSSWTDEYKRVYKLFETVLKR